MNRRSFIPSLLSTLAAPEAFAALGALSPYLWMPSPSEHRSHWKIHHRLLTAQLDRQLLRESMTLSPTSGPPDSSPV